MSGNDLTNIIRKQSKETEKLKAENNELKKMMQGLFREVCPGQKTRIANIQYACIGDWIYIKKMGDKKRKESLGGHNKRVDKYKKKPFFETPLVCINYGENYE